VGEKKGGHQMSHVHVGQ